MTAETPVFSQILLDVQNCLFRLLWFLHLLHDSVYTRFTITATSVGTGRQNKSLCQPKDIKIHCVETDSLISEYFAGLAYVICHFLCYANTPARQLLHLPRVNTVTRASVCYHSCSILARSTWVLSISNIFFSFVSSLWGVETLPREGGFITIFLSSFFRSGSSETGRG